MTAMRFILLSIVAIIPAMLPGCGPTGAVTYRPGTFVHKPDVIVVRPFAATLDDAKKDSDVVPGWMLNVRAEPQGADDPRAGRAAAEELSRQLVAALQAQNVPAVAAAGAPAKTPTTVYIVGQFVNADTATKSLRPNIGFRAGNGLQARVQIIQGREMIGELEAEANGGSLKEDAASITAMITDTIVKGYRLRGWLPPTPSK